MPAPNQPRGTQYTPQQPEEEPEATRRPFDLVNEFMARRRQAGTGMGEAPGRFARPQQNDQQIRQEFINRLRSIAGFGPAQAGQWGHVQPKQQNPGGIGEWGGVRMANQVIPYAQQLTNKFGLRLASGYRDPAHNRRVNGVPNSWHLKGRALDFSGSAKQMQNGAAWARQNGAREVLIHNAGSGTHLHVAW